MKKRRNNPKPRNAAPAPSMPATPVAFTRRQRIIFRLAALLFAPILAFAVFEAGLRITGYGYDTAFFKKVRIGNADFLVNNDKFIRRFFPPGLTRQPGALRMEAEKPQGVCRIFILGESAALGDPNPSYAAARYMKALLSARFSGGRFEVVNVSITAINSHAILPIARECALHDGDFWIVYMGNNEMVGPFGAATVFGAQAPPRWAVRLSLGLQQWRIGQLLMALTLDLKVKRNSSASWGGMEMFLGNQIPPDDLRKETVYRNFQENLRDILRVGLNSGAKVILNTVAVNLKDFPPFASVSGTNLGKAPLRSAGEEFLLAHGLLAQGNALAALGAFQQACDDDTLPFRADSRINSIIRKESAEFAGPKLVFCDAASPAILGEDPATIPGDDLFYEHVHLNFEGNYRLGRAWAEKIAPLLLAEFHPSSTNGWVSQENCDRLVGLTDWNRALSISEMIQRRHKPPLSSEANNQSELENLNRQLSDLQRRMDAKNADRARFLFEDAVEREPDDYIMRFNYTDFLEAINDAPGAVAQWRKIGELLPDYYLVNFEMARMLEREGKLDEAATNFHRALALSPEMSMAWFAWFELGNIAASQKKFAEALEYCERARVLEPKKASILVGIGRVLIKMGRHGDAEGKIRTAISLQPDYFDSHLALAEEFAATSRNDAAIAEFAEAMRLKPDSSRPHLELGELLLKEGKVDAAREQFQLTLRIDPRNSAARKYLNP